MRTISGGKQSSRALSAAQPGVRKVRGELGRRAVTIEFRLSPLFYPVFAKMLCVRPTRWKIAYCL